MAVASIGAVTVGDNGRIPFGWDEPDPDNPGERRAKNISTYVVSFEARMSYGDPALVTKSSTGGISEVDIEDAAGVIQADGTIRHGVVVLDTDDLAAVGSTTDLYCLLRLTKTGESHTTPFRLQARVVA